MPQRRFPPPCMIDETEACFIVRDATSATATNDMAAVIHQQQSQLAE